MTSGIRVGQIFGVLSASLDSSRETRYHAAVLGISIRGDRSTSIIQEPVHFTDPDFWPRISSGYPVIRPRSRIALSNLWETQHDFRRITCDCLATLVQTSNDFGQPPYLYLRDSVRGHYLRLITGLS